MRRIRKALIQIGILAVFLLSLGAAASAEVLQEGTDGGISWRIETSPVYDGVMYFTGSGAMEDHRYDCGDAVWAKSPWLYLVKRIEIGNGITHIGNNAFNFLGSASRLAVESVYIPDTVTSIGEGAFSNCLSLREVNIPGSVRTIGAYAFGWCSRLESLTLNAGLEEIGRDAFAGCMRLPAPALPASVKSIGAEAFYDCYFGRIVIPAGVAAIGERAFGYESADKTLSDFVVQGTVGSLAETYARSNRLLFATSPESIPRPAVSAANAGLNSVSISWTAVSGAASYEVYCKEGSSNSTPWKLLGTAAGCSYAWNEAVAGRTYSFTVKAFDSAGNPASFYGTAASLTTFCVPPTVTVSQTSLGVSISWKEATQSSQYKYRIFFRTGSGDWEKLTDTGGSSYLWTGAMGGTTYSFTVRRLNSDGTYASAADDTGASITVMAEEKETEPEKNEQAEKSLAAPKLSKAVNVKNGVKITWKKVSGAAKYRVFCRKGSGSWKKLKDTASTSYIWKKAKSGVKYSFTVCCISKDGKSTLSSYNKTGKSVTCLSLPKLSSVKKSGSGLKVTWKKTKGAKGYIVFRRTAKGSWKQIGKTASVSYTDKKAAKGVTYYYTVRAYAGSAKSYYNTKGIAGKR